MANSMETTKKNSVILKVAIFLVITILALASYFKYRDLLTLDYLATKEAELRQFQADFPILVYGLAFLIYVAATGFSLPGAAVVLSLTYAWYFKLVIGVILVSFASTTGATVAFLLSRYLFRDAIHNRFGDRLTAINKKLAAEGAFYLFTLRLIPAVPFFVINVVMGILPIKAKTFWWVSQVGMLPGTIVYVFAGSRVPDLATLAEQGVQGMLTPQLLIAFLILGSFPFVVKKILAAYVSTGNKDRPQM